MKHVMAACHRNFDRTFCMELTANIAEVFHFPVRFVDFRALFAVHCIKGSCPIDELHNFGECAYRVDSDSFNN